MLIHVRLRRFGKPISELSGCHYAYPAFRRVLNTVHGALICHGIYWYFVDQYGKPLVLLRAPWFVEFHVQCCYSVSDRFFDFLGP